MTLLKNIGRSPRGVHDVNGRCVVVEPNATKKVEITKATEQMLLQSKNFEVIDSEPAPGKSVSSLTMALGLDSEAFKVMSDAIASLAERVEALEAKAAEFVYGELSETVSDSEHQEPSGNADQEETQEPEDLTQLRKDAEDLGIEVDGRWGAKRLQSEIDNALRNTDSDGVQG